MAPPGMPNTTSAPTRSSAYTSACAPVACTLPRLVTCARGSDPTPCAGTDPAPGSSAPCAGTAGAGLAGAGPAGAGLAGAGAASVASAGRGWSAARAGGWCGERAARSFGLGPEGPAVLGSAPAGRSVPAGPLRPVICSVIGKSPLAWLGSGGIKNPLVPDGSRGERAVSCLVSRLRAGQVRESAGSSRVTPYCYLESERQPLTRVVSHSETGRSCGPSGVWSDVLIRASTPGAPIGLATRNP